MSNRAAAALTRSKPASRSSNIAAATGSSTSSYPTVGPSTRAAPGKWRPALPRVARWRPSASSSSRARPGNDRGRAPARPDRAPRGAGDTRRAAALHLPVPPRARPLVRAEGGRRARQLSPLLLAAVPLQHNRDDPLGRDPDNPRAHAWREGNQDIGPLLRLGPARGDHDRNLGDAELPRGEHPGVARNQAAVLAHQRRARPAPFLDARGDGRDLSIRVGPCVFRVWDQPIDRPPLDLVRWPRPLIFR